MLTRMFVGWHFGGVMTPRSTSPWRSTRLPVDRRLGARCRRGLPLKVSSIRLTSPWNNAPASRRPVIRLLLPDVAD